MEEMHQVCGVNHIYKQRPAVLEMSEAMHVGGRDEEDTQSFTGTVWEHKPVK